MNDAELLTEWRNLTVVEKRAELRGYSRGFTRGLFVGMLGAAVLVLALTEVLWWI